MQMIKVIKNIGILLLIIVVSFTLAACNGIEDKPSSDTNEIPAEETDSIDSFSLIQSLDLRNYHDRFFSLLDEAKADIRQSGNSSEIAEYASEYYEKANALLTEYVTYLEENLPESKANELREKEAAFEITRQETADTVLTDADDAEENNMNSPYYLSKFESTTTRIAELLGVSWDYRDWTNGGGSGTASDDYSYMTDSFTCPYYTFDPISYQGIKIKVDGYLGDHMQNQTTGGVETFSLGYMITAILGEDTNVSIGVFSDNWGPQGDFVTLNLGETKDGYNVWLFTGRDADKVGQQEEILKLLSKDITLAN